MHHFSHPLEYDKTYLIGQYTSAGQEFWPFHVTFLKNVELGWFFQLF